MEGQSWVWIWNGVNTWYQPNAQAQIIADKKSYLVGDTAHLLLVTGLNESWAVVATEGDSVQSRRVIHVAGSSAPFEVPINQGGATDSEFSFRASPAGNPTTSITTLSIGFVF